MARLVSLQELRDRSRQACDQENSKLVSETELDGYVNDGLAEMYDLIVSAYGEGFLVTGAETTTIPGQPGYPIGDLYKLTSAAIGDPSGGNLSALRRLSKEELMDMGNQPPGRPVGYLLMGDAVALFPVPNAAYRLMSLYVPNPPVLSSPGDTFDGVAGWDTYVVAYAACQCALKEENTDLADRLEARKAQIAARIQRMAPRRHAEPAVMRITGYDDRVVRRPEGW